MKGFKASPTQIHVTKQNSPFSFLLWRLAVKADWPKTLRDLIHQSGVTGFRIYVTPRPLELESLNNMIQTFSLIYIKPTQSPMVGGINRLFFGLIMAGVAASHWATITSKRPLGPA